MITHFSCMFCNQTHVMQRIGVVSHYYEYPDGSEAMQDNFRYCNHRASCYTKAMAIEPEVSEFFAFKTKKVIDS
ncbi:hypothetical protein VCHA53O466_140090 [Vibrio chagasii]|nr:hypothetical protein VCHA53O466_140090 [Vibrio chagasii]